MLRVNIMDPDLIKEVLSSKFREFGRPNTSPLGKYFIRGLVSYDGDKWFKHRKILNPAFSLEKLKVIIFACCLILTCFLPMEDDVFMCIFSLVICRVCCRHFSLVPME